MKILVILVVILVVFSAYFVFNTEKSISVKGGGNAIPAGIDIARSILNQSLNQYKTLKPKINDILQSGLTGEIISKIGEMKNKVLYETLDLIKKPIENKVSELFCPQN